MKPDFWPRDLVEWLLVVFLVPLIGLIAVGAISAAIYLISRWFA